MYIQNKSKHAITFGEGKTVVSLKVGYPVRYDHIDDIAKTNPAIAQMLKDGTLVKLDEKQADAAKTDIDNKAAARVNKK